MAIDDAVINTLIIKIEVLTSRVEELISNKTDHETRIRELEAAKGESKGRTKFADLFIIGIISLFSSTITGIIVYNVTRIVK